MASLDRNLSAFRRAFRTAPSKHEAHRRSQSILEDMSSDPAFLPELMQRFVTSAGVLNQKNYPVVSYQIELNEHFALVIKMGPIPRHGACSNGCFARCSPTACTRSCSVARDDRKH